MSTESRSGAGESLRRIVTLATGDTMARALSFAAFVHLARALGTEAFGVLEFANTVLLYLTLIADAGLEAWGARAITRTGDVRGLAGRVTGLRLVFAGLAFLLLLLILPALPSDPGLRGVLIVLGLMLLPQAVSLKWFFIGMQEMRAVAAGLVGANALFAACVFILANDPGALLLVAVFKLASEVVLAGYFLFRFASRHGRMPPPTLTGTRADLGSILTFGASSALSMINYNFDALLLGLMSGATAVGWYSAAYKPVTVALAIPMTFFVGLFPVLAGAYANDRTTFRTLVTVAIRFTAIAAIPMAVGGALLARPLIVTLFGAPYEPAIPVLQLLAWSLIPVMLRGTFRQGLKVAGHERVELTCAAAASGLNIILNVLLIPRYGMLGAAVATLLAEVVWVLLVVRQTTVLVIDTGLLGHLWRPALAGAAMAAVLWLGVAVPWVVRGAAGLLVYAVVVAALRGVSLRELRSLRTP